MERVFVTGVNGFIGVHLAEKLLKLGYEVVGLVRPSSDTSSLAGLFLHYPSRFRLVLGDVRDPKSLEAGMEDVDYIFHLAAVLMGTCRSEFFDTNFDGTCNVFNAALIQHQKRPLKRLVFTSSIAAAGPSPDEKPIDENRPCAPVSWYGRSKRNSEHEALKYMERGLPITIARPVLVYGIGDRDFAGGIFPWISRGISLRFGFRRKRLSMICVGDLVEGLIAAATSAGTVGETYFLSDPKPYGDIFVASELARAMKKWCRIPFLVPHWWLRLSGCWGEFVHVITGARPTMTRDKATEFSQRWWTVTPAKAKRDFGWQSTTPLRTGLQAAVADWRRRCIPEPPASSEPRRNRILKTFPLALAVGAIIEGLAEIGNFWFFHPWWVVLLIVVFGFGGILGGVSLLTAGKPRLVQFLAGGCLGFVGELGNALGPELWTFSHEFIGWLPQNPWIVSLVVGIPLGFVPVFINSVVARLYRRNVRLGCGPVQ